MSWNKFVAFASLIRNAIRAALTIFVTLAISQSVMAEDIVVTGKLLSNEPMDYVNDECPLCMRSWWKSVVDINMTIHGPHLSGRIAAAIMQHTSLNPDFKKHVRLFVLKPIEKAEERAKLRVDYYLEEMSRASQMFCFSRDPKEVGLEVHDTYVAGTGDSKRYCFELPTS